MVNVNIHHRLPLGIDLTIQKLDGGTTDISIIPQQDSKRQKNRAGFCGHDKLQFCHRPWPIGILGPKPIAPVLVPTIDLDTCGQSCRSNDEFGGPLDWNSGCRCVIPKTGLIPDPVFPSLPFGRCLLLTTAVLSQSGQLFGKGWQKLPRTKSILLRKPTSSKIA